MIIWSKKKKTDQLWWGKEGELVGDVFYPHDGTFLFSFDKVKIYNLFGDYPDKLTKEEKAIFDKENPFWVEYFEP